MAIKAIAVVGVAGGGSPVLIGGLGNEGNYGVVFNGAVSSDGITQTEFTGFAQIPLSDDSKKADKLIREAMASAAFTASGLVIDPNDIYIPFS